MRIIEIDGKSMELWAGRRLILRDGDDVAMFALPKSAMTMSVHNRRGSLTFGSLGRATAQVAGKPDRIRDLAAAILTFEAPLGQHVRKFDR